MHFTEISDIQKSLGLSDGKMAAALGVTRQTWRNWRTGRPCPAFSQNAMRWMMELRRVSPANDNLPERMRVYGLDAPNVVQLQSKG
jgi:DNA-binding transcriptional regulator YiaG